MRCCNEDMTMIYHRERDMTVAYGCNQCGDVVKRDGFETYYEWARQVWKMARIKPPTEEPK